MPKTSLITVAEPTSVELVEKKSRFIGHVIPVDNAEEARTQLTLIRHAHRDANHHVYAWIIGENNQFMRSSDDGEPAGTAGRPILGVIKKSGLQNIMVVVTRYFGGIMLGAGGLLRAYTKAAQTVLDKAPKIRKIAAGKYALIFDYPYISQIEAFLTAKRIPIQEKTYGEKVCFICSIAYELQSTYFTALSEITKGTLCCNDLGELTFLDVALN